jgi:gamma-glutamylputrescine oxidase
MSSAYFARVASGGGGGGIGLQRSLALGVGVVGVGLTGLAGFSYWRSTASYYDPSGRFQESKTIPGILETYYSQTVREPAPERAPLAGGSRIEADVCVIGGGLAGLNTALSLVEKGKKVVLLEEQRIGWGASGRNAGMAIAGFQLEGSELWEEVGKTKAKEMFRLSVEEGQQLLRKRIRDYDIKCEPEDVGMLVVSYFGGKENEEDWEEEVEILNTEFGANLQVWPRERVRQLYKTEHYHHAMYDPETFTLNPLGLVLGLARVSESKGTTIYEHTSAVRLQRQQQQQQQQPPLWEVITSNRKERGGGGEGKGEGVVVAKDVVIAGAAHLKSEVDGPISRAVVPVFTYIIVTEPLGEEGLKEVIGAPYAVCDDRFALNYYRPLPGGRILWGGLAQTYPVMEESVLREKMLNDLLVVYPQLKGRVKVESAWGGTLAFGMDMMPLIGRRNDEEGEEGEGVWYATGFGGHGLVPTVMAGELLASGIVKGKEDERWKLFQDQFPLRFVGGPLGRAWAQLTYWGFTLYDEARLFLQKLQT